MNMRKSRVSLPHASKTLDQVDLEVPCEELLPLLEDAVRNMLLEIPIICEHALRISIFVYSYSSSSSLSVYAGNLEDRSTWIHTQGSIEEAIKEAIYGCVEAENIKGRMIDPPELHGWKLKEQRACCLVYRHTTCPYEIHFYQTDQGSGRGMLNQMRHAFRIAISHVPRAGKSSESFIDLLCFTQDCALKSLQGVATEWGIQMLDKLFKSNVHARVLVESAIKTVLILDNEEFLIEIKDRCDELLTVIAAIVDAR
jgi:hypothetical protein